jgi:hypothetical protein
MINMEWLPYVCPMETERNERIHLSVETQWLFDWLHPPFQGDECMNRQIKFRTTSQQLNLDVGSRIKYARH